MRKIEKIITTLVLIALGLTAPALPAVTHTGKGVFKTTVVTETAALSTTSPSFVSLPGATATITVPALKVHLVNVRFSAESYCFGSTGLAGNWCSIRILADGVEMLPNSGGDFAFNANGATDDFWEGHAMERTLVLGPGSHTITAQWAVTNSGVTFRLDDWTFAVTQYNNGH
jgi:hypothetical protein